MLYRDLTTLNLSHDLGFDSSLLLGNRGHLPDRKSSVGKGDRGILSSFSYIAQKGTGHDY